ncbi:glycosyltransferase family 4 protein [Halothermothrix orenii]|uniref:Glycosyl transferase group 1 n=1 Tax=Halothermothrix orenii (strain H 168 / OCM 544 / DSM 9562) TaxID=373903 RepID=B8CX50_HALOH|nr:glycosyltransferase family 1 protein [Halothermothrix orenii]ACL69869.1 glycosyl transferase group 1 [Halothermothrix orenii H 168]
MKVALFTDTFSPQINGVTKNLDKLINYYEKHGIKYIVFAPKMPEIKDYMENNIIRLASLKFILYPECRVSLPNYFKIKEKLDKFKPDLIKVITPFNLGLCGLRYSKRNNIPLIASYHTNFDKYLSYYNLRFLEKPVWNFLKWFHGQSSLNLCPSKMTKRELEEKGIENIRVWGRGIDTDLFSPEKRSNNVRKRYNFENKLALLYVGRLAPEKNLKLLIKAVKLLNKKYKNKISLILTGEGPMFSELKEIAPENTIFTGYLTGKTLASIYVSSDVFVFPSVTETYGNVILEAMASGLPVVAFDAGGVKENLIDRYNGLACFRNNIDDFVNKIEEVISNESLRETLGQNARQHALNNTWNEVFNELFDYYRSILGKIDNNVIKSA